MEKKKKYLILGIIILLALGGVTVAYLTWSSNKINIGLNSDCFTIDYTKGGDINNASVKLMNESDLIDSNNKFTIKEGIALTYANIGIKSTCGIEGYGSLYLNITSLSDAFTTGNSVGALKYAILKNTSTSTVSVANLLNQSFDIEKKGTITSTGTKEILTKQLSNTEVNKYIIVIYIDNNKASNDVIGASFSGKISASANQGKIDANYTLQKLNSLNSTIVLDTTKTPDFSTVSGNSGVKQNMRDNTSVPNQGDGTKGIYSSVDDFGTTYYFRGDVDNNYLSFAGQMWRIVRINGDGSIRIVAQNSIGTSVYNTSKNDNAYVGYMYGTPGSSSYAETHKNINDSTIKAYLDNWYNNNLSSYADYIEDTIYCNDRSISSVTNLSSLTFTNEGYGTNNTLYMSTERNSINHSPSLKCSNVNDRFTVSTSKGNGALTVPIGLLTVDEIVMSGAGGFDINNMIYIDNKSFYLYFEDHSWTMTPVYVKNGHASVESNVIGSTVVSGKSVDDYNLAVRPVVSLNADAITGGDGTMNNPFTVG